MREWWVEGGVREWWVEGGVREWWVEGGVREWWVDGGVREWWVEGGVREWWVEGGVREWWVGRERQCGDRTSLCLYVNVFPVFGRVSSSTSPSITLNTCTHTYMCAHVSLSITHTLTQVPPGRVWLHDLHWQQWPPPGGNRSSN